MCERGGRERYPAVQRRTDMVVRMVGMLWLFRHELMDYLTSAWAPLHVVIAIRMPGVVTLPNRVDFSPDWDNVSLKHQ